MAAVHHWSQVTTALFAEAEYHRREDPLDRVLAYLDLRADLVEGSAAEYSCLAGTVVQEIHASHPAIREAADSSIRGGAARIETHLTEALLAHPIPGMSAYGIAMHIQGVIQGAFILGKARDDSEIVRGSMTHLQRYLRLLFGRG